MPTTLATLLARRAWWLSSATDGAPTASAETVADRLRAGVWILACALPLFGLGDVLFHRQVLAPLLALKVAYLGLLTWGYMAVGPRPGRARVVAVALTVVAGVAAISVASNALVGDILTTFLLVTVLNLATAALLPWGAWVQAATVAITYTALLVHLAIQPGTAGAYYPPAVATLLGAIASVRIAAAFDSTRRAQARAEVDLRASEERKSAIVDAALECIVTVDERGDIVEFNPAAERTFGYTRAAVLGRSLEMMVPQALRSSHREEVARLVAGGTPPRFANRRETSALRADGTDVPIELAVAGFTQAGRQFLIAYARDITERRLAQQGETSAALVHVGHAMMQLLEPALVVAHLGVVVHEMLGAARTITLLRRPGERDFHIAGDPNERLIPVDAMQPLLGMVDTDGLIELVGTAPDRLPGLVARLGDPTHTALCIALWTGGEIVGVHVGWFEEHPLAFTVEERRLACGIGQIASMALTTARLIDELARASRVKSEFVSTISHELRTPINVVLGYAEMARDPEIPPAERDHVVERIAFSGLQLLQLVEGALDIGRLEAGQSDVDLAPLDLREFSRTMLAVCREMPRQAGVPLVWSPNVPARRLVTDVRKLSAVVRNLVGNACKFTERGHVDVRFGIDGDVLEVAVADTGIGIRPEDHALVFEMYRQADGSETRRFAGTGVGLYIVRRFVEQLGGTVTLASTLGVGSTFTVRLPIDAAPAALRAA